MSGLSLVETCSEKECEKTTAKGTLAERGYGLCVDCFVKSFMECMES